MPFTKDEIAVLFEFIDPKWKKILITENKNKLNTILDNLPTDKTYMCPKVKDIFHAFRLTSLDNVRVVIVGQDPYTTIEDKPVAHGLSFSSKSSTIPPSLKNIYKCLKHTQKITIPHDADLTQWASQGVLMINRSLTVMQGQANGHKALWEDYTGNIIDRLCRIKEEEGKFLIFLLWGGNAKSLKPIIGDKHMVWSETHPSPMAQNSLSADRKFTNCSHFKDINDILDPPINWNPADKFHIFTDGACTVKKPRTGGWSFYIANTLYDDHVMYGNVPEVNFKNLVLPPTNQRAEGLAIINAFKFILDKRIMCDVNIISDSEFWINLITDWMHKWYKINSNFTTTSSQSDVKNPDLVIEIYKLYTKLSKRIKINFQHINSHQKPMGDQSSHEYFLWYGNHIADYYAGQGSSCKSNQFKKNNI